MSNSDATEHESILGLELEEALDEVFRQGHAEQRRRAQGVLLSISDNEQVTEAAFNDLQQRSQQAIETSAQRLERAADTIDAAAKAAAEGPELTTAQNRRDGLEERLSGLQTQLATLREELAAIEERAESDEAVYPIARDLLSVHMDATNCEQTADQLTEAAEEFQQWVADPAVRWNEIDGDVDAMEDTLRELEETIEILAQEFADDAAHDGSPLHPEADPAEVWFDVYTSVNVNELLLEDLQFELSELRAVDDNDQRAAAIDESIASLETERADLAAELESITPADIPAQFDAEQAELADTLAEFEPPIDWGALRAAVDDVGE
jgi:chromosome segregation ATPase